MEFRGIAQWTIDNLMSVDEGTVKGNLTSRTLSFLRKWLICAGDPTVSYALYSDSRMQLPLSHELPLYRKRFPLFLENLGRISSTMKEKYPDLSVIDIGANVGDSALVLQHHSSCRVLCLEGSARYYDFLKRNLETRFGGGCVIERVLVGTVSGTVNARLVESGGTARLVDSCQAAQVETLEKILSRHSAFSGSKLIKVDTDGLDLQIVSSAFELLRDLQPVLFLEYDPQLEGNREWRMEILLRLSQIGYHGVLAYLHTGDLLLSTLLSCEDTLYDLDCFLERRPGTYLDLCLFPRAEQELFRLLLQSERDYFEHASLVGSLFNQRSGHKSKRVQPRD